jgi:hypothetical protein
MSKLYNKEGDSVHDGWPIAKYVRFRLMRFKKMNHQDKQLTSFLSMTIGSALDDYMANLAKQIAKAKQARRNIKT